MLKFAAWVMPPEDFNCSCKPIKVQSKKSVNYTITVTANVQMC